MAFFLGLVLVLGAGFGVGRVVGGPAAEPAPVSDSHTHAAGTGVRDDAAVDAYDDVAGAAPDEENSGHGHPGDAGTPQSDAGTGTAGTTGTGVGGLAISDAGFRLAADSTTFAAGRIAALRFRIIDVRGRSVTRFTVLHDKPLHLIVVRRDLSGFQHLHPSMASDGTWSVPLTLPEPGAWRAYADFTATGSDGRTTAAVLGVDLTVAGDYRPRALPVSEQRAAVAGFDIGYEGRPVVGTITPLLFHVTKAGAPAAVGRYLGAYGHLVVLREGDLGYVHVHPEEQLVSDAVKFWLTAPSAGRYRMFLDFQVAGAVHTAEFTLVVQ